MAKFIAIPPPIVPAPITATESIDRSAASLASPGTLLACRSAKKTCCSAFACGSRWLSSDISRSTRTLSANGRLTAASTQRMLRSGAFSPRVLRAMDSRNLAKYPSSYFALSIVMFWIGRRGAAAAINSSANLTASSIRSPLVTRSTAPASCAASTVTGSPDVMTFNAKSTLATRGRRCVP